MKAFKRKKNIKIIKRAHAFKDYVSSYTAEVLNSFKNKLMELLTQLKGFKFVTTLVLAFKR